MGYLNGQPQDDYLLAATADHGTAQLAAPTAWEGTGKAIAQGLGGALSSVNNAADDFTHMAQRFEQDHLPSWASKAIAYVPWNPAFGATVQDSMPDGWQQNYTQTREELEKWVKSDKQYQGSAAQTAGSVTKGLGEFLPSLFTGPAAPFVAAATVGGASADDTYRDLTAQGVDDATAKEAAFGQGVVGALGAAVPFKFGSAMTRVLGTAGINVGLGAAGRTSNWAILKANGYDDMAAAQHPLDRQAMMADLVIGLGFGALAHGHAVYKGEGGPLLPQRRPTPEQIDAAQTIKTQAHADDLAYGVPADPETAALHQTTLSRAIGDVLQGRRPEVDADTAQRLADGSVENPNRVAAAQATHAWAMSYPEVRAAHEVGALLDAARARFGEDAGPFEGLPKTPPIADEPGTGMVSPDEVDDAMMAQLEAKHGDLLLPQEDGTQLSVRDMAERMRETMENADNDHKLMDAAVACFLRTGATL